MVSDQQDRNKVFSLYFKGITRKIQVCVCIYIRIVRIIVIDGIWTIRRWPVLLSMLHLSRKTSADQQTCTSTCHFSWTEWLKSIDSAFCSKQWVTGKKKKKEKTVHHVCSASHIFNTVVWKLSQVEQNSTLTAVNNGGNINGRGLGNSVCLI